MAGLRGGSSDSPYSPSLQESLLGDLNIGNSDSTISAFENDVAANSRNGFSGPPRLGPHPCQDSLLGESTRNQALHKPLYGGQRPQQSSQESLFGDSTGEGQHDKTEGYSFPQESADVQSQHNEQSSPGLKLRNVDFERRRKAFTQALEGASDMDITQNLKQVVRIESIIPDATLGVFKIKGSHREASDFIDILKTNCRAGAIIDMHEIAFGRPTVGPFCPSHANFTYSEDKVEFHRTTVSCDVSCSFRETVQPVEAEPQMFSSLGKIYKAAENVAKVDPDVLNRAADVMGELDPASINDAFVSVGEAADKANWFLNLTSSVPSWVKDLFSRLYSVVSCFLSDGLLGAKSLMQSIEIVLNHCFGDDWVQPVSFGITFMLSYAVSYCGVAAVIGLSRFLSRAMANVMESFVQLKDMIKVFLGFCDSPIMHNTDEATAQGFTGEPIMPQMIALATSLLMSQVKGATVTDIILSISKNYSGIIRAVGATTNVMFEILSVTPVAFQHCCQSLFGFNVLGLEPSLGASDESKKIVADMVMFSRQTEEVYSSPVDCSRMLQTYTDALRRVARPTPGTSIADAKFDSFVVAFYKPHVSNLRYASNTSNSRVTPVGLYLFGESGIGKTAVANCIAQELFGDTYTRYQSQKDGYFNGYGNQKCLIYDDFLAVYDKLFIEELIRLVSSVPFITPQADIAAKGTPCVAEGVILTTNFKWETEMKGLTDTGAFKNRFVRVDVLLKKEYDDGKGRLKKDEETIKAITEDANFPHLIFRTYPKDIIGDSDHVDYDYRGFIEFGRKLKEAARRNHQAQLIAAAKRRGAQATPKLVNRYKILPNEGAIDIAEDEEEKVSVQMDILYSVPPVVNDGWETAEQSEESKLERNEPEMGSSADRETKSDAPAPWVQASPKGITVASELNSDEWPPLVGKVDDSTTCSDSDSSSKKSESKSSPSGTSQAVSRRDKTVHKNTAGTVKMVAEISDVPIIEVVPDPYVFGDYSWGGMRKIFGNEKIFGQKMIQGYVTDFIIASISAMFRSLRDKNIPHRMVQVHWIPQSALRQAWKRMLRSFSCSKFVQKKIFKKAFQETRLHGLNQGNYTSMCDAMSLKGEKVLLTIDMGNLDTAIEDSFNVARRYEHVDHQLQPPLITTDSDMSDEGSDRENDAIMYSRSDEIDLEEAKKGIVPDGVIENLAYNLYDWAKRVYVKFTDIEPLGDELTMNEALIYLNYQVSGQQKLTLAIKAFCYAGACAVACFCGYKVYDRYPLRPNGAYQDALPESWQKHSRRHKGGGSGQKAGRRAKIMACMGMRQSDVINDARPVIAKNVVMMSRQGARQYGFFLSGNIVYTSGHFWYDPEGMIADGTIITIDADRGGQFTHNFTFERKKLFGSAEEGSVIDESFYCVSGISHFKNMEGHFTDQDFEDIPSNPCQASIVDQSSFRDVNLVRSDHPLTYNIGKLTFRTPDRIMYDAVTKSGDCGLPVVRLIKGQWKIVGFHVAILKDRSWSCGLHMNQDYLSSCLSLMTDAVAQSVNLSVDTTAYDSTRKDQLEPHKVLECLGFDVRKGKSGCFRKEISPYRLTPISGEDFLKPIRENFQPCISTDNDPRLKGKNSSVRQMMLRPMLKSVNKEVHYEDDLLEFAFEMSLDRLRALKPLTPARMLTKDEAINGTKAFSHVDAIDLSTSGGYNCSLTFPSPVKRNFFTQDQSGKISVDKTTKHGRALNERIDEAFLDAENGIVPDSVLDVKIKREVLPNAKVDDCKSRCILVSPVEHTLVKRAINGAFIGTMYSYHGEFGSCVGLNPHGSQWDEVMKRMHDVSPIGWDGDYEGYETIANKQIIGILSRKIAYWYEYHGSEAKEQPVIRTVRNAVIETLSDNTFRADPFFYRNTKCLSSGDVLTTAANTENNETLLAYSFVWNWRKRNPNLSLKGNKDVIMDLYKRHFRSLIYGDDVVCAIGKQIEWFTQLAHAECMRSCGANFTPSVKTDPCTDKLVPLTELTFIGNDTVVADYKFAPGRRYWAIPTEKSLLLPMTYFQAGEDAVKDFILICNDCIRRNFPGGGEEEFNSFRDKVVKACHKQGIVLRPYTWQQCVQELVDKGEYKSYYNPYTEEQEALDEALANLSYVEGYDTTCNSPADKADAQMDTSDSTPTLTNIAQVPSETLGQHNVSDKRPERVGIMELCKRPASLSDRNMQVMFLEEIDNVDLMLGSRGYLSYLASLYRFWAGGLNIRIYTKGSRVTITSSNENKQTHSGPIYPTTDSSGTIRYVPTQGFTPLVYSGQVTGFASAMVPWCSEMDFSIIPQFTETPPFTRGMFYSTSTVTAKIEGQLSVHDHVLVSGSDSFTLATLYKVPSLRVVGRVFPHSAGNDFEVPETIGIMHAANEQTLPLSYETLVGIRNVKAYKSGPEIPHLLTKKMQSVASLDIDSEDLTDEELRALGFPIKQGQSRLVVSGTIIKLFDLSKTILLKVAPISIILSSVLEEGDNAEGLELRPNPENYETFVLPSGLTGVVSDMFTVEPTEVNRPDFLKKLGLPEGYMPIPDNSGPGQYPAMPMSRGPVTDAGVTYLRFTKDITGFYQLGGSRIEEKTVAASGRGRVSDQAWPQMEGDGVTIDHDDQKVETLEPSVIRSGIGDSQLSFPDLAERPQVITTVRWDTNQPTGTQLLQLNLPRDLIVSPTIASPFNTYQYVSYSNIHITVTQQSNPFQQGCVIMYSVPNTDPEEVTRTHSRSLTSQTTLPNHVLIMAGENSSTTLTVPWVYPTRALNLDGRIEKDPLAALWQLSVFSPLKVGEEATVNYVYVTISASIEGAVFSVPRVLDGDPPFNAKKIRKRVANIQPMHMLVKDLKDFTGIHEATPQAFLSPIGSALATVGVTAVASLAAKAIDFGNDRITGGESGKKKKKDRDKPNDYANPGVVRMTLEPGGLAPLDGMTYTQPLDERIGQKYEAPGLPQVPGDDDLTALCARPSYFGRFLVTTMNINEQVVFSTELSPTQEVVRAQFGAVFQPTLPCYLSLMATFWKCDTINYRITMVGAGQSVRLAFLSNYDSFEIPKVETYSQFVTFHDFDKKNPTVEIKVPWRTPRNRLRVSKGYDADRSRYSPGSFYARVIGALQTTEVLSSSVEFLVFVSFENMQLEDFSTGPIDFEPE